MVGECSVFPKQPDHCQNAGHAPAIVVFMESEALDEMFTFLSLLSTFQLGTSKYFKCVFIHMNMCIYIMSLCVFMHVYMYVCIHIGHFCNFLALLKL